MNYKKLITFIIFAFLPMIGVGLAMYFIRTGALQLTSSAQINAIISFALSAGAMLIPMLAVILTQLIFKESVFKGLDISFKINRWWVIGWLLMPVIALLVVGVTLLMPGAEWAGDSEVIQLALKSMPEGIGLWGFIGITMLSGLVSGITINAVFGLGEEIAWRGYLMQIFKGKKFMVIVLWTGLIWGLWHAPIILNGHNYPQHPEIGVLMMVVLCLLLTPMLMYFRLKSGSVIVPAIMHGTYNGVVGLSMILVTPANDLLYGGPGLAGMITLLLINICLFIYDRYISKENIFIK